MAERLFLRLDGDPLYAPETGAPAGTMQELALSPALRQQVAHIMLCDEHIPASHELVERVLPDGAVRLIFSKSHHDGGWSAMAIGAARSAVVLRLHGHIVGVSVTLRAGAVAGLLGVPAGELAGHAVALEDLWNGDARALLDRIGDARDAPAIAASLELALLGRLPRNDTAAQRQAVHAARLIADSGGERPLRDVADAIGVGERRLQQLFHSHVGLSPRGWRRIARLHACLRLLRATPQPSWAEVAANGNFYDQSHLVNEFQDLCGLTPGQFLDRAISGSSKTVR